MPVGSSRYRGCANFGILFWLVRDRANGWHGAIGSAPVL